MSTTPQKEYRAGRLTRHKLRHLLGFANRAGLDAVLNARGLVEGISTEEFDSQM